MTCGTQAMVRPAMIRFRSISDMADLSRRVVIDWRQIAAERADPVTASNRDRITPQIHILLDQPGVPRSCFIEGQPLRVIQGPGDVMRSLSFPTACRHKRMVCSRKD